MTRARALHGLALVCACLSLLFALGATPAVAAEFPAPTGLEAQPSPDGGVSMSWEPGEFSDLSQVDLLKSYQVRRDGKRVVTMAAVNGVAKTAYVDQPPPGTHRYTVVAVYQGGRSKPSNMELVNATGSVAGPPAPDASSEPTESITGSGWREFIGGPDLRGDNKPTPFEEYGGTPAMTEIPDNYDPGPFNIDDAFLALFDLGFTWLVAGSEGLYLLVNGFFNWTLQTSAYDWLVDVTGGFVKVVGGSPNFVALVTIMVSVGGLAMMWAVRKGSYHQFGKLLGVAVGAAMALAFLVASPIVAQKWFVEKSLRAANGELGGVKELSVGTDADVNFRMTVVPTYFGNEMENQRRLAENQDWIVHQYLTHCAEVFGKVDYVTQEYMTGTRTPWCEAWIQAYNSGEEDRIDEFESALEEANESAFKFYQGRRLERYGFLTMNLISGDVHMVLKGLYGAAILVSVFMALFELALAVISLPILSGLFPPLMNFAMRRGGSLVEQVVKVLLAAGCMVALIYGEWALFAGMENQNYFLRQLVVTLCAVAVAYYGWKLYRQMRKARRRFNVRHGGEDPSKKAWRRWAKKGIAHGLGGGVAGIAAAEAIDRAERRSDSDGIDPDAVFGMPDDSQRGASSMTFDGDATEMADDNHLLPTPAAIVPVRDYPGAGGYGYGYGNGGPRPQLPPGDMPSGGGAAATPVDDDEIVDAQVVDDDEYERLREEREREWVDNIDEVPDQAEAATGSAVRTEMRRDRQTRTREQSRQRSREQAERLQRDTERAAEREMADPPIRPSRQRPEMERDVDFGDSRLQDQDVNRDDFGMPDLER